MQIIGILLFISSPIQWASLSLLHFSSWIFVNFFLLHSIRRVTEVNIKTLSRNVDFIPNCCDCSTIFNIKFCYENKRLLLEAIWKPKYCIVLYCILFYCIVSYWRYCVVESECLHLSPIDTQRSLLGGDHHCMTPLSVPHVHSLTHTYHHHQQCNLWRL